MYTNYPRKLESVDDGYDMKHRGWSINERMNWISPRGVKYGSLSFHHPPKAAVEDALQNKELT